MKETRDLETLSVNAIRFLAIDAVEKARSGHPGMPMGMAPLAYLLFREVMRHNPLDPDWPDRDRFVLPGTGPCSSTPSSTSRATTFPWRS